MASWLRSLVERKVVQWTLGYLAAAWAMLEALGFLAELFGWGQVVVRVATVLLGTGVLAVIVLSWFHGERGRQRVGRLEAVLLAAIAVAGTVGAVIVGPAPPETELAVAVLPPTDLGGAPIRAHFVTGMHEALISRLANVGAIRVISRRSTLRFAGTTHSVGEIASELGVDAVVESSVTQPGDSVRIQVRLIRAVPEERLLWSETFGAGIRNVLAMHGDVARAIAREVEVELTPAERARLASADPVDPETYEAYLRGMHILSSATPGDVAEIQRGLDHLYDAVDRDPADPLAYAGLALGYATLGHGFAPPPDAWPRAREAARRAVTLDPSLAEAHAALADVKLYYEWDWDGAEREFRRANELNPSLAMNRYHYAWYLALMGRLDEAIAEHREAKRLDPLTPMHTAWLGELYTWDGRPEQGIEEARAALDLNPRFPPAYTVLGNAYLAMGRYDDAIRTLRRQAELAPVTRGNLGRALAVAGREEEARRIRDELAALEPTPWRAWQLILVNAALGDFDRAFHWMAYEPHHAFLPWLAVQPGVAELRRQPQFDEFLRRLDLPQDEIRLAGR